MEALGGRSGTAPLPVGAVVVTRYQPGARWRPRLLSPGRTALALLANTVAARRKPRVALARLAPIAASARTLQGARGEADEMAAALLNGAAC